MQLVFCLLSVSEPHGDGYFINTQNQQHSVSLFHLVFIFALKNTLEKIVSKLNMRESMVYFCSCHFSINSEFENPIKNPILSAWSHQFSAQQENYSVFHRLSNTKIKGKLDKLRLILLPHTKSYTWSNNRKWHFDLYHKGKSCKIPFNILSESACSVTRWLSGWSIAPRQHCNIN